MRKILSFLMLSLPASAAAREAVLESFTAQPSTEFAVLVPGVAAPRDGLEDQPPFVTSTVEFPALARHSAEALVPHLPAAPGWMRAGVPSPSRALRASQRHDPDCLRAWMSPPLGIGPDAQIRRGVHFDLIATAACEAGVPVRLFDALIAQESRYQPFARSSAGAMGLAQLMPETARHLGVSDPWDPLQNLRAGARYLRAQIDRFGSWELALAAYNAGPARVARYGGIPPFRETRAYVRTIMSNVQASRHGSSGIKSANLITLRGAMRPTEAPEQQGGARPLP